MNINNNTMVRVKLTEEGKQLCIKILTMHLDNIKCILKELPPELKSEETLKYAEDLIESVNSTGEMTIHFRDFLYIFKFSEIPYKYIKNGEIEIVE
jgi:hypothetical protein